MATLHFEQRQDSFDPTAWLTALSSIGGGYDLVSGRRLAFMVSDCDSEDLAVVMSHLIGRTDRQEAVKFTIEQRQNGEVSA